VKARLVGTLNGYLRTPVTVSSMDLTLIERFPQASIHLRDVLAHELRSDSLPADTLLYARDLYLEFSLLGMFRGDYTVSEVHGEDVIVRPGLDASGRENWVIWKVDTAGSGSAFALDRVTLAGLLVRYRDARSQLEILASSDHLRLGGTFADAGNALKVQGHLRLDRWSNDGRLVLSDREADVRAELAFGGEDGGFRITRGEVIPGASGKGAGMMPLAVTMTLIPGNTGGDELDLRANGLGLDLAGMVQLLPEAVRRRLLRYGMTGEVDLALGRCFPWA
jgi:hypothetical protein